MSKRVVALHNNTDERILLLGRASGKTYLDFPPTDKRYLKGRHAIEFDIPDNSDSSRYWDTNNMAVLIWNEYDNELGYITFWDDDDDDFKIKYFEEYGVPQTDKIKLMRGGDKGGNYAKVALHVFEHPSHPGKYELTAVTLTEADQRKNIASSFKEFTNKVGMRPDVKHTQDTIRKFAAWESARRYYRESTQTEMVEPFTISSLPR
jgi:hypothetical protein